MAKLVTVARYSQSFEAEVARGRLAENNIQAVLQGTQSIPFPNGINKGPLFLQVFEDDVEAAKSLLALDLSGYDDELTALEAEGSDSPDVEEMPKSSVECPRCGSDNLMITPFSWDKIFWSAFLLFIPLAIMKRDHECSLCGMKWRA